MEMADMQTIEHVMKETSEDGSTSSFLCPLQPIEFDRSR